MTTGLGTPISSALGAALCSARAPVYTVKLKKGALTITLKKSATRLTISLSKPALKITKAEAKKVKKGKVKSLTLKVIGIAKKQQIARSVTVGTLS